VPAFRMLKVMPPAFGFVNWKVKSIVKICMHTALCTRHCLLKIAHHRSAKWRNTEEAVQRV
jgi:hypothetical protein